MKRRKLKVKRQGVDAWAWLPWADGYVYLSIRKPVKPAGVWRGPKGDAGCFCRTIIEGLTGHRFEMGAKPTKVHIPAWTVVEAKAKR